MHLLSFQNLTNTSLIIEGNTFQNLSIAGPLIALSEAVDSSTVDIRLFNNDFRLITGQYKTNVLSISRFSF